MRPWLLLLMLLAAPAQALPEAARAEGDWRRWGSGAITRANWTLSVGDWWTSTRGSPSPHSV